MNRGDIAGPDLAALRLDAPEWICVSFSTITVNGQHSPHQCEGASPQFSWGFHPSQLVPHVVHGMILPSSFLFFCLGGAVCTPRAFARSPHFLSESTAACVDLADPLSNPPGLPMKFVYRNQDRPRDGKKHAQIRRPTHG